MAQNRITMGQLADNNSIKRSQAAWGHREPDRRIPDDHICIGFFGPAVPFDQLLLFKSCTCGSYSVGTLHSSASALWSTPASFYMADVTLMGSYIPGTSQGQSVHFNASEPTS